MLTTSDWVLIGTALFLGATALFVPMLAELLTRTVFAPKIGILFHEVQPFCLRAIYRSAEDPNLHEPVYYFRFQVSNDGRSQARLCEAVSEGLWIYDTSGKASPYPSFTSVNLGIEGSTPESGPYVNINPNRRVYCAIGHIDTPTMQAKRDHADFQDVPGSFGFDILRFWLDQKSTPFHQPNCMVPGKYALKVSLYSENARPVHTFFEITWSGKWQDSEQDMFHELLIRQVNHL